MSNLLTAQLISQDLVDYLSTNKGKEAKVISISTNAVNLLAEDGALITLSTPKHAIMPMGLIIQALIDMNRTCKVGDLVRLDRDNLVLDKLNVFIDPERANIWDPSPDFHGQLISHEAIVHIKSQLISWLSLQPRIGLLPLLSRLTAHSKASFEELTDPYSLYIAEELIRFVECMHKLDWQSALNTANSLVGFGIGSTPSCDDFLVAYLVVLSIAQKLEPDRFRWVRKFNRGISELGRLRTTTLSANMLDHAASGKVSRNHQRLIHACIFVSDSDWFEVMREVAQTGASSGMDFLLGLTCALEWVVNNVDNYPMEGGMQQVVINEFRPVTII